MFGDQPAALWAAANCATTCCPLYTRVSVSAAWRRHRSEEHTSELQSLMRISYAVFCLKKKTKRKKKPTIYITLETKSKTTIKLSNSKQATTNTRRQTM